MRTLPEGILAQHGELSSLIAGVRQAHAQGASWPDLARMLDGLIETVQAHFDSEEGEMARVAFPMLDEHRANHDTFVRRLQVLRAECDRRETELMALFMDMLDNWFKNHERTADQHVLDYLAGHR